jgi:hypothetical protein
MFVVPSVGLTTNFCNTKIPGAYRARNPFDSAASPELITPWARETRSKRGLRSGRRILEDCTAERAGDFKEP